MWPYSIVPRGRERDQSGYETQLLTGVSVAETIWAQP